MDLQFLGEHVPGWTCISDCFEFYSGCCFDDVPPNRMAQCEEGHLFCLSCARQAAEVELGYQRTVLKCMTSECASTFKDSEAVKFLARPVFQGLQRARQQSELKMVRFIDTVTKALSVRTKLLTRP